jgi:hypothetical protein
MQAHRCVMQGAVHWELPLALLQPPLEDSTIPCHIAHLVTGDNHGRVVTVGKLPLQQGNYSSGRHCNNRGGSLGFRKTTRTAKSTINSTDPASLLLQAYLR